MLTAYWGLSPPPGASLCSRLCSLSPRPSILLYPDLPSYNHPTPCSQTLLAVLVTWYSFSTYTALLLFCCCPDWLPVVDPCSSVFVIVCLLSSGFSPCYPPTHQPWHIYPGATPLYCLTESLVYVANTYDLNKYKSWMNHFILPTQYASFTIGHFLVMDGGHPDPSMFGTAKLYINTSWRPKLRIRMLLTIQLHLFSHLTRDLTWFSPNSAETWDWNQYKAQVFSERRSLV